ncbi:hypothetical protein KBA39_00925 [Myxococcota bacterium]|nr:hypothetical protein [Myxococcota bacterium]
MSPLRTPERRRST